MREFITDPRFKVVENPKDAKIVWLSWEYESKAFLDFGIDENNVYVSFFKKEGAMCIKNQCANMINATLKDKSCIQETFDLNLNLPNFIGYFNERKRRGLDNTWIIKPTSMARSIDIWVSNNVE
jgi:tubulin--tyrosine ligase-like protein 12